MSSGEIAKKKDSIQIIVQQDKQAKGTKMQNKRVTGTTISFDNKSENPYGQQQPGSSSLPAPASSKKAANSSKPHPSVAISS